jgi:hypothetical protein
MNIKELIETSIVKDSILWDRNIIINFGSDMESATKFFQVVDKVKSKMPPYTLYYGYNSTPKYLIRDMDTNCRSQLRYLKDRNKPQRIDICVSMRVSQRYYGSKVPTLYMSENTYADNNIDDWRRYYRSNDIIEYHTLDDFRNIFDIDL